MNVLLYPAVGSSRSYMSFKDPDQPSIGAVAHHLDQRRIARLEGECPARDPAPMRDDNPDAV